MVRFFLISLLLAVPGISGCGNDWSSGPCDNADAAGYTTLEHDGVTREYVLSVPDSYASDTPVPLVIAFHGNGGCATDFNDDLSSMAEANDFIVAYPQGVVRGKGAAEWNPVSSGTENINENDAFFTEQLISTISTDYSIDSTRVYAVGYSNGGMMSYGLACERGDLIAAVGIMSGVMLTATCDTEEKTSLIHFHGTEDSVLPIDGSGDFPSVDSGISFWLSHNNIDPGSLERTELNGGDVTRDAYSGGDEGSAVVLYTIANGGHVWFSDEIGGLAPNQILWDFLSAYDVDGLIADTADE